MELIFKFAICDIDTLRFKNDIFSTVFALQLILSDTTKMQISSSKHQLSLDKLLIFVSLIRELPIESTIFFLIGFHNMIKLLL